MPCEPIADPGHRYIRIVHVRRHVAAASWCALASRVTIEQAKGILAQRDSIQVDDAFDKLRIYARHNGLRLTDVATGVVNRTLDP